MKTPIDLSSLTSAQKDALIMDLLELVNTLTQLVQELQAQLKLNSRNSSSKLSLSDGYGKHKPKSTRSKSGERSGGQPGLPGQTLKMTAHPDHIVYHAPDACMNCGLDLSTSPVLGFAERQVFDIPPIKIEATEHPRRSRPARVARVAIRPSFPNTSTSHRANRALMLDASRINHYDRRYSRILRQGLAELPVVPIPNKMKRGRTKQHEVNNLHVRLFKYKAKTLAFLYDLTLPFDNNLAERDVRMIKAKLKISGCFRSEEGADIFCRVRGYISEARKQNRNVLAVLRDCFLGQLFHPATA